MNLQHDDTIHASFHGTVIPVCGRGFVINPTWTDEPVNCAACIAALAGGEDQ